MEDDNFNTTDSLDLECTSSRNCSKNSQNASPTRFSPFELKNNALTTIFNLKIDENLPPESTSPSNSHRFPKKFYMANTDTEMQEADANASLLQSPETQPLAAPKTNEKKCACLIYSLKRKVN